jgi:hypothetical protein
MKKYDLHTLGIIKSRLALLGALVVILASAQNLVIHLAVADETPSYGEENAGCGSIVCSGSFVPDSISCECTCSITSCDDGAALDKQACQCVSTK